MRESLVRLLELKLDQNLLQPLNSVKTNVEADEIEGNSDGADESNDEMAAIQK
jgi:hypothetical protein